MGKGRTMALKIVTANRSGFSENPKKEDALIKKLTDCRDLLKKGVDAKKDAVKSIGGYLKTVPHGQGTKTLKVLCEKAGIHMDTYYQWKNDVEDDNVIEKFRPLVKKDGRTLDTPMRRAILQAYADDPQATFPEVLRKTYAVVDARKAPSVKVEPRSVFVEAVESYLRSTNEDANGLLDVIKRRIPKDKICAALKGLCQ